MRLAAALAAVGLAFAPPAFQPPAPRAVLPTAAHAALPLRSTHAALAAGPAQPPPGRRPTRAAGWGLSLRGLAAFAAAAFVALAAPSSPGGLAPPAAWAAAPSAADLARLPEGLARIDILLEDWDKITTVCTGVVDDTASKQVVSTIAERQCKKSPLRVQQFIGQASTKDPLFRADKIMRAAQPLVADEDLDKYDEAVEKYIAKQQIASTMAYTSSWSGYENPGGSNELIDENLLEAKKEVQELRSAVATVVGLLHLKT